MRSRFEVERNGVDGVNQVAEKLAFTTTCVVFTAFCLLDTLHPNEKLHRVLAVERNEDEVTAVLIVADKAEFNFCRET